MYSTYAPGPPPPMHPLARAIEPRLSVQLNVAGCAVLCEYSGRHGGTVAHAVPPPSPPSSSSNHIGLTLSLESASFVSDIAPSLSFKEIKERSTGSELNSHYDDDDSLLRELVELQQALAKQRRETCKHQDRIAARIQRSDGRRERTLRRRWEAQVQSKLASLLTWKQIQPLLVSGTVDVWRDSECAVDSEDDEAEAEYDVVCWVCFDGSSPYDNPIVFCDKCNTSVHKSCYGIVEIPEDDWICDFCQHFRQGDDNDEEMAACWPCALCPVRDGALKLSADGHWVHVTCALWAPGGSSISDFVHMQVEGIEQALLAHGKRALCEVCAILHGVCVQCSEPSCERMLHPMCAWYAGLYVRVTAVGLDCRFELFCKEHTPMEVLAVKPLEGFAGDKFDKLAVATERCKQQRKARHQGRLCQQDRPRSSRKEDIYERGCCAVCFAAFEQSCDDAITKQEKVESLIAGASLRVQCKQCGMEVHAGCYGMSLAELNSVKLGNAWVCVCCKLKPNENVGCALCPRIGGAMKPAEGDKWVHVVCAEWIPEVSFSDLSVKDVAIEFDSIPRVRRDLRCHLCKQQGPCIQCSHADCEKAFHPLCNFLAGSYMFTFEEDGIGYSQARVACCRLHTPTPLLRGVHLPLPYSKLVSLKLDLCKVRDILGLVRRREQTKLALWRLTCFGGFGD